MVQWNRERKLRGVALHGASAPIRALMTLQIRALEFLNRRSTVPIDFFKDEARARQWIEELRARGEA